MMLEIIKRSRDLNHNMNYLVIDVLNLIIIIVVGEFAAGLSYVIFSMGYFRDY